ncbi:hypothetical protein [Flavobacterium sp. FlaQc-48]|uniref:hypothetical protein n=1 Tax=Flavobacterium sp. FlaQc-48 TaxID=3374181 RepID=UPI00375729BD
MSLNLIQLTKINTKDFKFKDLKNLTFPIPPLASANFFNNGDVKTLKICATLYVNSKESADPTFENPIENGSNLEIYFDYIWDKHSPKTYDVWYVELDYTSKTVGNITEVISYLRNIGPTNVGGGDGEDPTISRGTKTSVGV